MGGLKAQDRPDSVVRTRPFFALSLIHDFQNNHFGRAGYMEVMPRCETIVGMEVPSPARIQEFLTGVFEREAAAEAAAGLLNAMQNSIANKGARDRFVTLLRHDDRWLFDSIEWVLSRDTTLRRELLRAPEYTISLPISNANGAQGRLSVPLRLGYLLYQSRDDATLLEQYKQETCLINSGCLRLAEQIAGMLSEAEKWYLEVLEFFFNEPWVPGDGKDRTLPELLREVFPQASDIESIRLFVDACGAPDAFALEESAEQLIECVFDEDGERGRCFLEDLSGKEKEELLTGSSFRLRAIAGRKNEVLRLQDWHEIFESGIIRKEKGIRFDIGNPIVSIPELTLHELTHAAFASVRPAMRLLSNNALPRAVIVRCLDRTLEEGVAEFFSDRALRELYRRFPLLDAYRKLRFRLLQSKPNDPHITGFAAMRHHHGLGNFSDSETFLQCAESVDFNFLDLLRAWGEDELPQAEIEGTVAVVPAMQIEIGGRPEIRSVEFDREWFDIAVGTVM